MKKMEKIFIKKDIRFGCEFEVTYKLDDAALLYDSDSNLLQVVPQKAICPIEIKISRNGRHKTYNPQKMSSEDSCKLSWEIVKFLHSPHKT